MKLFKRSLKRFEIKNLFVCKVFAADNLRYRSYFGMIGEYDSLWDERFLGIKILYGNDKTLKDPIYDTKYVAKIDSLDPDKNLYYRKLGNITDIFNPTIIGKKSKISLTKIEELNTILKAEYDRQANKYQE